MRGRWYHRRAADGYLHRHGHIISQANAVPVYHATHHPLGEEPTTLCGWPSGHAQGLLLAHLDTFARPCLRCWTDTAQQPNLPDNGDTDDDDAARGRPRDGTAAPAPAA